MNIEHMKHLYEYHFAINRKMWEYCIDNLTMLHLVEDVSISHGSIRNLFVHILGVDQRWFSGIRKVEDPGFPDPLKYTDIDMIRKKWDIVEEQMKEVLAGLTNDDLEKTFQGNMKVWQVLAHVVNHGTQHRAQLIEMLKYHNIKPVAQDYIRYVMGGI